MAFDGNGNYTVPPGTFAVSGELISSAAYNALLLDLQTALSKALLADGQRAATQNIALGGNRITALADAISATDAVTKQQLDAIADNPPGMKNLVLNSNFAINQRGVSGTVVLAAGAYGHDMWKAGASGCTYTFATSGGVNTLTISAGSLIQPIAGNTFRTGDHTLSWTGTAQGRVDAGSYAASGLTAALTGGTNSTIEFNTGTVSLVQLENGTIATPYEYPGYTLDLNRCERHYEIIRYRANGVAAISSQLAPGADYFQWSFRQTKSSAPTITLVTGAWNGGTPVISVSLDGASFLRATGGFYATGTAGAVALSASSPL